MSNKDNEFSSRQLLGTDYRDSPGPGAKFFSISTIWYTHINKHISIKYTLASVHVQRP